MDAKVVTIEPCPHHRAAALESADPRRYLDLMGPWCGPCLVEQLDEGARRLGRLSAELATRREAELLEAVFGEAPAA